VQQDRTAAARSRYQSLDAWRGAACLMVVVYHATAFGLESQPREALFSFGGLLLVAASKLLHGVTLFFVISGYCISAAVDASARRRAPIADYFWRRFRRIFPPFWIFFALTALGVTVAHAAGAGRLFEEVSFGGFGRMTQPSHLSGTDWIGNLTLTEIWLPAKLGREPLYLESTGHAWTLAYEEQFYAVCGLLLVASRRRMSHFFAGALAVVLLCFVFAASPALRATTGGLFLDGRWILFACGIAVYYDRMYAGPRQRWMVRGLLVALLVLSLSNPLKGPELIIAPAFALALIGLQRWDAAWSRARAPRFLWWCGTRCYSLYLVHWAIIRPLSHWLVEAGVRSIWATLLITLPVSLGISVLAAWWFHAVVERRFLNRPDAVKSVPIPTGTAELVRA
jgi:peptidoglycan/LPS O-acetylase OafA/YrhL